MSRELGRPILSILPESSRAFTSEALYKANFMLEEPALIVRTAGGKRLLPGVELGWAVDESVCIATREHASILTVIFEREN